MNTSTTTNANQNSIPTWIFWYGAIIMTAVPLAYAIMTFMGPDLGTKNLADGSTIDTAVFKYAVRNVAAAAITAFALFKRSAPMLFIIFIMRFITESGDLLDSLLFGGLDTNSTLFFVGIMVVIALIPYALGIRTLWPMVR